MTPNINFAVKRNIFTELHKIIATLQIKKSKVRQANGRQKSFPLRK